MKRLIYIFFFSIYLLANSACTAMQFPELPKNYYTLANLARLDPNKPKHAACAFLMDAYEEERPDEENLATTLTLGSSIIAGFFPIIVSSSIIYNLITNKRIMNVSYVLEDLNDENKWSIYDVDASGWILLMPKKYEYYYIWAGLNVAKLGPTIHLDKISLPKIRMNKIESLPKQLAKIFLPKDQSATIWDFLLGGHGDKNTLIAGVSVAEMNNLLSYFDFHLNIGIAYIVSCSLGGKNRTLLETKENIPVSHAYIIIISSIADAPVSVKMPTEFLTNYFHLAAHVEDKTKTLNEILSLIKNSAGDQFSIPQVWLPGGLGFQTLKIDEKVEILGNVKVKAHELENKPIRIVSKDALLIYPQIIKPKLIIVPKLGRFALSRVSNLRPIYEDLLFDRIHKSPLEILNVSKWFPAIEKLKKEGYENLSEARWMDQRRLFRYPIFISMNPSDNAAHHFSDIDIVTIPLKRSNIGINGLLTFLRDSFIDVSAELKSDKEFFIDRLTGPNDIPLLLELQNFNYLHTLVMNRLFTIKKQKYPHGVIYLPADYLKWLQTYDDTILTRKTIQFLDKITADAYEAMKWKMDYFKDIPMTSSITLKNVWIKLSGAQGRSQMRITFTVESLTGPKHWIENIDFATGEPIYQSWNFQDFSFMHDDLVWPEEYQKKVKNLLMTQEGQLQATDVQKPLPEIIKQKKQKIEHSKEKAKKREEAMKLFIDKEIERRKSMNK